MNPLQNLNPIERQICNKADLHKVPIAGNIELLPLCNMDCKMCFAKMTREQMEAHHPMYTAKDWIALGEQMRDMGTIFMLFTGGEPFLYPDFKKLYQAYKKMGYIVSINTNGTLINEEIADYLALDKPRRLNITMYGPDDETYAKLCRNPHGFTQLMKAIKLLKERKIDVKFNCSLTPWNLEKLEQMYKIAEDLEIPMEVGFYMFPPVRKNNVENVVYRLGADEAARGRFLYERLMRKENFHEYCIYALERYEEYGQDKEYQTGYSCRSGNSVFWINYDGKMSACSFSTDCQIDVFEHGFANAWHKIVKHVGNSCMPEQCHICKERFFCGVCASACISETGSINRVPTYYCDLTNAYIELLKKEKRNEIEF